VPRSTILGHDFAVAAHRVRRTRDFLISSAAFASLVTALLTGRARELWIGDSHTVCFNRSFRTANVLRGGPGVYVFHLGSRLMFSIARDGDYPRWARRLVALTARLARRPLTVFFCLGEIDVRCHLARHGAPGRWDFGFVAGYAERAARFARENGFRSVVFVTPPPPCRDQPSLGHLPVAGSFETRTSAFDGLRAALADAVAGLGPGVRLLDATELLYDPSTGIRRELTDDNCHVNAAGARLVRELIGAQADAANAASRMPSPSSSRSAPITSGGRKRRTLP